MFFSLVSHAVSESEVKSEIQPHWHKLKNRGKLGLIGLSPVGVYQVKDGSILDFEQ